MFNDKLFTELVEAASLAPSADNMQPWEFRHQGNSILVFCAAGRVLPTDVGGMFGWISIGAAIQNIVVSAGVYGMTAMVTYESTAGAAAVVHLMPGNYNDRLAKFISLRNTNRCPYDATPLEASVISVLSESIRQFDSGVHWTTTVSDLDRMAHMDANSSYIRLKHKPLHDELFNILRFTRKEIETTRYGLTFESLEVPSFAVFFARQLQYWSVSRIVSRLGFDRMIAKHLSDKLRKAGALCLITAYRRNPAAYMEAGRAMQQLWLTATSAGLSVQPYGVLPQYLTKVEIEPETFLPSYAETIRKHRKPFFSIFSGAVNEFPAIVLRVGRSGKQSARSSIRLTAAQLIRT